MINPIRKGNRNERRSRDILKASGYQVTKSGGSLGAWDLIGIGSVDCVLCQVKTRFWPGPAEMETLTMFPCPPNVKKIIHRWRDRQRFPDVKQLN
jgi:hypothetical protein